MKSKNQAVNIIVNTVGIDGLIAIKSHMKNEVPMLFANIFYVRTSQYKTEREAYQLIFNYLSQYKDFAQYQ
jgi:hypothetical protein